MFSGLTPNDIGLKFYYHPWLGSKCERPKLLSNLNTLKHNSFSSVGPALFNIIPKEIKDKNNLEQFKRSLDRYLKVFTDTPPVPGGYVLQNGNSLLEWACSNILLPGKATLMELTWRIFAKLQLRKLLCVYVCVYVCVCVCGVCDIITL